MVAIRTIACPITILLNLLVVIAVKSRRELKKNSNILLSSVALADLLVGAVSMPLAIALDTSVINKVLVVEIICTIDFVSVTFMYTICCALLLHLLLIAWERYIVTTKWMEYKAMVTVSRVKKYSRVAWLLTVLMVVPLVIAVSLSVRSEIVLVVDVTLSIFLLFCLSLIAYFYVKAYLAVRNWNRMRIRPVNVQIKGKLESRLAYTTFLLTLFVGVSTVPIFVVHVFHEALPFFRQISTIRWAETILQLNSLFNPLLYWYRNRPLREATLELLRCRKMPAVSTAHHIKQRRNSLASLDVEKLQNERRADRLLQSESTGTVMCLDAFGHRRNEAVKEISMSAASNQLIVTVQIENAQGWGGRHSAQN